MRQRECSRQSALALLEPLQCRQALLHQCKTRGIGLFCGGAAFDQPERFFSRGAYGDDDHRGSEPREAVRLRAAELDGEQLGGFVRELASSVMP